MIAPAVSSPLQHRAPVTSLDELIARAGILQFTVEQYERMLSDGILPEGGAYELLCGLIVRKDRSSPGEDPMGHGPLHRLVISLLIELAGKISSPARHMQVQLPLICPPHGVPEADASIVRGQPRDYKVSNPTADDASCVIEAAHSSLERDRVDKSAIYAAAGIRQFIIIDLENNTIEVCADPDRGAGVYRASLTLAAGDTLTLVVPDGTLDVAAADLLPG